MSKRPPSVSVLTANRLSDGIAVFLAADGGWVECVDGAAVARSAEEVQALQAQGARDAARNLVVEPYLAEVAERTADTGDRLLPHRMRERLRVEGPSILADVPGYLAPGAGSASHRATARPPRTPSARGEVQPRAPTQASVAAPPPNPLPATGGRVSVSPVSSPEAA
jgi:hypothetical protein